MPFALMRSVRWQLILWIFGAILLSWIASGVVSTLLLHQQIYALRRTMLARPDLYPQPIPPPRFHLTDLLFGPQSLTVTQPPPPRPAMPRVPGFGMRPPPPPGPPAPNSPVYWPWGLVRIGIALLFALGTGLLLGRRFTDPLLELAKGARTYREGKYGYRIPLDGEDEFAEVADAMHDMAAQVYAQITQIRQDAQRRRQLLADVAHELRNPAMTIRTMAGALEDGVAQDPERHARAIASLARTSDRLMHLVTDLLVLAKLDLQELPLHRETLDLRELLQHALQTHRSAAEGAGITLAPLEDGPPVPALVDPDRIAQVVDNLLTNAISYAGTGAAVRVSLEHSPPRIHVADTGRGIPARHLPFIFDPFYRADAARTPQDAHSGLGLRIARGIIEAHGGTLELTSSEGAGTAIVITLPR